uniref:Amiloride-sensitive sodium channel n=1 Tax=Bursaphelenchus xylophilus TaxID=6326 RepID=A0A1I7RYL0_BURXY
MKARKRASRPPNHSVRWVLFFRKEEMFGRIWSNFLVDYLGSQRPVEVAVFRFDISVLPSPSLDFPCEFLHLEREVFCHVFEASRMQNLTFFATESVDCADSIINVALEDSESFSIEQCNCPYDCDQSFYLIAMSQAKWVPPSHIPPECANQSISSPLWSTSDECIAWYKENTIMLELYFERPYYQSNLEASAYSWTDALADVGGQLGLWLGMSVISLVELGMLAGVAIAFVFLQPKNVNIKGYDYWKEFNNQIDAKGSDLYKADAKEDPLPPKIIHSDDLKSSYSDIGHTGQEMP